MTNGELLSFLEKRAIEYREGALSSIRRNRHMNEHTGADIAQEDVDALLVDFINFIASRMGGDYGLRSEHIKEKEFDM